MGETAIGIIGKREFIEGLTTGTLADAQKFLLEHGHAAEPTFVIAVARGLAELIQETEFRFGNIPMDEFQKAKQDNTEAQGRLLLLAVNSPELEPTSPLGLLLEDGIVIRTVRCCVRMLNEPLAAKAFSFLQKYMDAILDTEGGMETLIGSLMKPATKEGLPIAQELLLEIAADSDRSLGAVAGELGRHAYRPLAVDLLASIMEKFGTGTNKREIIVNAVLQDATIVPETDWKKLLGALQVLANVSDSSRKIISKKFVGGLIHEQWKIRAFHMHGFEMEASGPAPEHAVAALLLLANKGDICNGLMNAIKYAIAVNPEAVLRAAESMNHRNEKLVSNELLSHVRILASNGIPDAHKAIAAYGTEGPSAKSNGQVPQRQIAGLHGR